MPSTPFSCVYYIHKRSTCMKKGWTTIQAFRVKITKKKLTSKFNFNKNFIQNLISLFQERYKT